MMANCLNMLKSNPILRGIGAELFAPFRMNIFKCQTATLKYYEPPPRYDEIEWPEENRLKAYDKKPLLLKPRTMKRYLTLMRGNEKVHTFLIHKQYGIQAVTGGRMAHEHFEFFRKNFIKIFDYEKVFAVWRVDPPWQAVSKKGIGKRMGGGKSKIHHYVTPLKAGRIVLEIGGIIHPVEAKKKLAPLIDNLPFPSRFVSQEMLEKEEEEKKWREENNLNRYNMRYVMLNNMGGCNNWLSPYDYETLDEDRG